MGEIPKRVLDIGIGFGGRYLDDDFSHIQRVGVDYLSDDGLRHIRKVYPNVRPVLANAQFLPFVDGSFDRIQIIMPFYTLLTPGLQESTHSNAPSWYREFWRVLKKDGDLIIVGDHFVNSKSVSQRSKPYFSTQETKVIDAEALKGLGTTTSLRIAKKLELGERTTNIGMESLPEESAIAIRLVR